jgi:S-adenosyl methyltransferase
MSEVSRLEDQTPDVRAPRLDTTVAHNARVWDYWLGGKDNFAADREVGDRVREMFPVISDVARANRQFLIRVVRYLARDAGIRQFLDIGTGLPTASNTHEVAQSIAPESRIVYVDNDPLVLAHARALLTSSPDGATDYIDADAHDPDLILGEAARTLDFSRPVAVMMLGILNFVLDDDEAMRIVGRLLAAVPPGSYLALTHPTLELGGEMNGPAMAFWNERARPPIRTRTRTAVAGFVDGLVLLEPGLVSCALWRPELGPTDVAATPVPHYAAVARKP